MRRGDARWKASNHRFRTGPHPTSPKVICSNANSANSATDALRPLSAPTGWSSSRINPLQRGNRSSGGATRLKIDDQAVEGSRHLEEIVFTGDFGIAPGFAENRIDHFVVGCGIVVEHTIMPDLGTQT